VLNTVLYTSQLSYKKCTQIHNKQLPMLPLSSANPIQQKSFHSIPGVFNVHLF